MWVRHFWAFQFIIFWCFLIFILMWPGVIRLIFLVLSKEFLWMLYFYEFLHEQRLWDIFSWFYSYLIGLLKIYKSLECLQISFYYFWGVWLLLSWCILSTRNLRTIAMIKYVPGFLFLLHNLNLIIHFQWNNILMRNKNFLGV